MLLVRCNRCKIEIDPSDSYRYKEWSRPRTDMTFDLCKVCYYHLMRWLKNQEDQGQAQGKSQAQENKQKEKGDQK